MLYRMLISLLTLTSISLCANAGDLPEQAGYDVLEAHLEAAGGNTGDLWVGWGSINDPNSKTPADSLRGAQAVSLRINWAHCYVTVYGPDFIGPPHLTGSDVIGKLIGDALHEYIHIICCHNNPINEDGWTEGEIRFCDEFAANVAA